VARRIFVSTSGVRVPPSADALLLARCTRDVVRRDTVSVVSVDRSSSVLRSVTAPPDAPTEIDVAMARLSLEWIVGAPDLQPTLDPDGLFVGSATLAVPVAGAPTELECHHDGESTRAAAPAPGVRARARSADPGKLLAEGEVDDT
jgi:hypothetical protein